MVANSYQKTTATRGLASSSAGRWLPGCYAGQKLPQRHLHQHLIEGALLLIGILMGQLV